MILHKTHHEEAILSNVGQVGEFRIRNSAKAFNILSSGLYANKIRAIIRELSCNALDSHRDAGRPNVPFDVHLPTQLEPWFAIRDYGTGLDHKHLTDIYTTYFESTKTGSNDFIGALGLGSKSPFSYTDNFTVTAIKDGRKGIYTAFINEKGVPSVALMTEEQTSEPAGVEVKFSVNDRYDNSKFAQEAVEVFKWFKQRPVVSGYQGFTFADPKYADKDIIPGVHSLKDTGWSSVSYAVMGNIAYPIEIPESDTSLGTLAGLLKCGLVMEFGIGELDFQASREGLSYIPQTIAAIKRKLEALNAQLAIHLAQEANKLTNLWERGVFLEERFEQSLWTAAVEKYVTDTKFPLMASNNARNYHSRFLRSFTFTEDRLAQDFNIKLRGFYMQGHRDTLSSLRPEQEYNQQTNKYTPVWSIPVDLTHKFVINDTAVGIQQRAKGHYKTEPKSQHPTLRHRNSNAYSVYIFEKADKTKPMKITEFYTELMSPPVSMSVLGSSLRVLPRKSTSTANATILRIEDQHRGRWNNRQVQTWVRAGELKDFDKSKKYYYLPMRGFQSLGKVQDIKMLRDILRASGIHTEEIYGVRKADLKAVKSKKNWIDLDKSVEAKLTKLPQDTFLSLVRQGIDKESVLRYDLSTLIDANSPYAKLWSVFSGIKKADHRQLYQLERLCSMYDIKMTADLKTAVAKYKKEVAELCKRYPLLEMITGYTVNPAHVAEYLNGVDLLHKMKDETK